MAEQFIWINLERRVASTLDEIKDYPTRIEQEVILRSAMLDLIEDAYMCGHIDGTKQREYNPKAYLTRGDQQALQESAGNRCSAACSDRGARKSSPAPLAETWVQDVTEQLHAYRESAIRRAE